MWFHSPVGAHLNIHRMIEHRPHPQRFPLGHPRGAGCLLNLALDAPGGMRSGASRSLRTLPLTDRPTGSPALISTLTRQQRRRLVPMEPRRHRRLQILQHRPSLLTARRDHRPDPLAPLIAALAPRPLRDPPVDHHEPDRRLRQVVRRFHPGGREQPEITLPMHVGEDVAGDAAVQVVSNRK